MAPNMPVIPADPTSNRGALRAAVLTPMPDGGVRFDADRALTWEDGAFVSGRGGRATRWLLIPGLVDAHVHLPQFRVRGRFHEALLPWLRQHIWPEEERFADYDYRQAVTRDFRAALLRAGTTSAGVYGSPTADSAWAVLEDLAPVRSRGGDVLMDRNGNQALLRTTERALADATEHAQRFGARYLVTPRFAPTCSDELLAGVGRLLGSSPVGLQTHLAENRDEVAWVNELFPGARSYTEVYQRAGLLGPRSLFGHCIHLDDEDLWALSTSGSWAIHCPTSNLALSSGRMPIERLQAAGVRLALATDVGAGPDLSMLDVIARTLQVHIGAAELAPSQVLRLATLAGARALGIPSTGALVPGWQADFVALRVPGGVRPSDDGDGILRRTLAEFDGRWEDAVAGVWIGGRAVVRDGELLDPST